MKYDHRDESSIKAVMAKANVVINLIGREYETRNYSFEEVNHHMAEQLAIIAKEHGGIVRFIQVSCLGASPSSSSRYLKSKAATEEAVLRELPKDDGTSMGKDYELGGPDIFTVHELADLMYDMIREWPRYMNIPFPIAKAIAMPREILLKKVPVPMPTPTIFNLDLIEALATDALVSENALKFEDLRIAPHKLKGYPVEFLIQIVKVVHSMLLQLVKK